MSIVRTYSVFCDAIEDDGSHCPVWVAETVDGVDAARRTAKAEGWVRRNRRDLCPDHATPPGRSGTADPGART